MSTLITLILEGVDLGQIFNNRDRTNLIRGLTIKTFVDGRQFSAKNVVFLIMMEDGVRLLTKSVTIVREWGISEECVF